MKKELNIAAILKDKPNTKVWSDAFGELTLKAIREDKEYPILLLARGNYDIELTNEGYYFPNIKGILPCIVPSKEMQDWSKFAWKKGDVLTDDERFVVFKGFNTDDYTEFSAAFEYEDDACRQNLWFVTNDFRKVSDNVAQEVIKKVEEHYGGKLNLETLTIEQPKPEFKDGDIVTLEGSGSYAKCVIIFKNNNPQVISNDIHYHALLNVERMKMGFDNCVYNRENYRLATDSEKQQLYSALEREGKAWNPDTKQIEDLPKKCEFKVFQEVLVRELNADEWIPNFYFKRYKDGHKHVMVCGDIYNQCIPYNEDTKHLLGTTDEWKGGEG